MRVVFFGTPEFAVPSLERLVASRHEVVRVVSRPDKPVGRQQLVTPPAVVQLGAHGIEACSSSLKGEQAARSLPSRPRSRSVATAG
jgi:methionyl-tRNA formyltransferase